MAAASGRRRIAGRPTSVRSAQQRGQISPDLDLDVAMAILSGPLYFQFLITQEPLTHQYVDRVLKALLVGMTPRS
ncbi:TetR-like C-terminal domain-containing protein [Micromonospora sp. NPDC048842]|uniref:TetR-like C-terminal domain-containing protein n=1 Tax=unclassified Micromonospora TaxID=2617518 RepID=UPI003404BD49